MQYPLFIVNQVMRMARQMKLWWLICLILFSYGFVHIIIINVLNTIIIEKVEESDLVLNDVMNCGCSRQKLLTVKKSLAMSTCDSYSTFRGPHQMVIAYAFHGQLHNAYFKGIAMNAQLITRFYPNWVVRVYHNISNIKVDTKNAICNLWCKHHHVDFCDVANLPSPLHNQSNTSPRVWRFFVLGDPLVDRFVSRDLDSLISEREMAAVGDWLISGKTWHFMRDHPLHAYPIMAGMWGGLNHNLSLTIKLRQQFISDGQNEDFIGTDQALLRHILLPVAEKHNDYINHDSYSCHHDSPRHFKPWPIQRKGDHDFVGSPVLRYNFLIHQECPEQCRPSDHQDWTFC